MAGVEQIPHLVKLLDDDSADIRETVIKELIAFGPTLGDEIVRLPEPLSERQQTLLSGIMEPHNRYWLSEVWPKWYDLKDEYKRLETALSLLAEFQNGRMYPFQLSTVLDRVASEFMASGFQNGVIELADFLFRQKKLKGAESDYFHPQNSNLVYVIEQGRGIPISLVCIYMLVGQRLDLDIEGCNFPGHFLAKVSSFGRMVLVDCYGGGRIIEEDEILAINPGASDALHTVIHSYTNSTTIISRVLRNLIRAYYEAGEEKNSQLMLDLLKDVQSHQRGISFDDSSSQEHVEKRPLFKRGQLVRHKRYGYRGVVVEYDLTCQASEIWYQSNQTQPSRDQPWYHVLVDQSNQNTYAAQSNLEPDSSDEPVEHPLLDYFFKGFEDGFYIRNDQPWTF